jgi:hypothetical protein
MKERSWLATSFQMLSTVAVTSVAAAIAAAAAARGTWFAVAACFLLAGLTFAGGFVGFPASVFFLIIIE